MNRFLVPPIFCDECSAFALVEFEDRILCGECLLKAVAEGCQNAWIESVLPLSLILNEDGNPDRKLTAAAMAKAMRRQKKADGGTKEEQEVPNDLLP